MLDTTTDLALDSTDPASPNYTATVLCDGLHCHPNRTMVLPYAPSIPAGRAWGEETEDESEIPVADVSGLRRALRCAWPYFLLVAVVTLVIAYHQPWVGAWH